MTTDNIDKVILMVKDNISAQNLMMLRETLQTVSDDKVSIISMIQFKSPVLGLVLSLLFGGFGVNRFYAGDIGLGVGKLLTLGGCGIWAIVDYFLIMKRIREKNFMELMNVIG